MALCRGGGRGRVAGGEGGREDVPEWALVTLAVAEGEGHPVREEGGSEGVQLHVELHGATVGGREGGREGLRGRWWWGRILGCESERTERRRECQRDRERPALSGREEDEGREGRRVSKSWEGREQGDRGGEEGTLTIKRGTMARVR